MMNEQEWRGQLLETVAEIADREYQERVWQNLEGNEGGEVASFTEAVCGLFDDLDFDGYLAKYCTDMDHATVGKKNLRIFRDALTRFVAAQPEQVITKEILCNPEWHKIRELAQEVLDTFGNER